MRSANLSTILSWRCRGRSTIDSVDWSPQASGLRYHGLPRKIIQAPSQPQHYTCRHIAMRGGTCRSGRTGSEGSQRNPHEISKVSDEQIIGSQWFRAIFISKPAEGRLVWESGNQCVDPNVDGKGRMNAVASPTCLMVLVGAHVVVGSHFHRVSGSFCPSYTGNNTRSGLRLACSGSGCNPTFHHGWPLALKRPSEMIDQ